MTDKEYILKLMYMAFLDIRVASYSQENHTSFVLADIFHNVPLQINRAEKDNMDYADIVEGIRKKCEERRCLSWLENATVRIAKMPQ